MFVLRQAGPRDYVVELEKARERQPAIHAHYQLVIEVTKNDFYVVRTPAQIPSAHTHTHTYAKPTAAR